MGIGIDVGMDIDSNIIVSIKWGSSKGGARLLQRGWGWYKAGFS